MKLSKKFKYFISLLTTNHNMYLSGRDGILIVAFRKNWDDGLSNRSNIRLLIPSIGLSSAPSSWAHMIRLLELNKVDLAEFARELDERIQLMIRSNYLNVETMIRLFGKSYVETAQEQNEPIEGVPSKFQLTLVDGGKED